MIIIGFFLAFIFITFSIFNYITKDYEYSYNDHSSEYLRIDLIKEKS